MPWTPTPVAADCGELIAAVGGIYAAVGNPALWPDVLEAIADLVESEHAVLFANYVHSVADDVRAMARSDARIWHLYREYYAAINVWTEGCDRIFPTGTVRYSHLAIPDAVLKKTEFYSDFLKPNDMAYGFGIEIAFADQPPALFSAMRSLQRGPFEEKDGRILEALLPHLQRALRLHFELTMLRSAKQGFEQALDAFGRAVFGLNAKGKILFCNQTARQLLARGDGLCIRDNHLAADLPAQDTQLKFVLAQAAVSASGFSATGATLIQRKSGKAPFRLTLMPFAGNLLAHIPELTLLIFVDDPMTKPSSRANVLRSLFHLSPAEARLTDLLASGVDLASAGEQLQMSAETARFYLKSIFRKTGVNRQARLLQLVHGLPGNNLLRPF